MRLVPSTCYGLQLRLATLPLASCIRHPRPLVQLSSAYRHVLKGYFRYSSGYKQQALSNGMQRGMQRKRSSALRSFRLAVHAAPKY